MQMMNSRTLAVMITVTIMVLVILSMSLSSVIAAQIDEPANVIIGFKDGRSHDVKLLVEKHGGAVKKVWHIIPAMSATLPQKAIDSIRRSPDVTYVEQDGILMAVGKPSNPGKGHGKGTVQPPQGLPWGVDRINATGAWKEGSNGIGIKVAVLDTGIDYTHPDLDANVKGGVSLVGVQESTNPKLWKDKNGHGTWCAGIIAAENNTIGVVGVAPNASLYAVKVLRNDGTGTYSDLIDGIEWSVDNGMQVISMSLGGTTNSTALKEACDAAYGHGLILVAAAGNEGDGDPTTDEVLYPAAYDSVIAVSATNASDIAPYWSSSGDEVELAAPGVNITSTWLDGTYESHDGTSASCPHVSGTIALVLSMNSTLQLGYNTSQVRELLRETAHDLGVGGTDPVYGYGLVDAGEAVFVLISGTE